MVHNQLIFYTYKKAYCSKNENLACRLHWLELLEWVRCPAINTDRLQGKIISTTFITELLCCITALLQHKSVLLQHLTVPNLGCPRFQGEWPPQKSDQAHLCVNKGARTHINLSGISYWFLVHATTWQASVSVIC